MQRDFYVHLEYFRKMDECCVEYYIYIPHACSEDLNEYNSVLSSVLTEGLAYLSQFCAGYIWQNEAFNLTTTTNQGTGLPCLCGQTNYGDNVEDEWFIVFLLYQLSSKYPDICIRVNDSDGNFLLIEAAHELPKWLTPEISENRVFIHDGNVHIISLPSSPREITMYPTGTPTLEQALEIINGPFNTLADIRIQQVIQSRIKGYPEKAHLLHHHANCLVLPEIKFLLDEKPNLISSAVLAFCHRDPIDMKAIKQQKFFPPGERVLTRVRFTQCLYAQMMHQEFHQDRKAGWKPLSSTSTDYRALQLGLKLISGFEILCSKSNSNGQSNGKLSGPQWKQFLQFLTKQGYFKGEVDGSKLYNKLLSQAEHYFQEAFKQQDINTTPGDIVLSLLESADINVSQMKEEEKNLPPEDDDSWLSISPDELETMLKNYRATGNMDTKTSAKTVDKEMDFSLDALTLKMKSFVDQVSSHEGAEFPGENENEEINFNPDVFVDTMRKLLDGKAGNLESDDDDDDFSDLTDEEDDQELSTKESGELFSYMEEMDKELAQTNIGESFEKSKPFSDDIQEDDAPVDIDMNLVKNFLESFSSQQGLAGPATNILNAMGMVLPREEDDEVLNDGKFE